MNIKAIKKPMNYSDIIYVLLQERKDIDTAIGIIEKIMERQKQYNPLNT